MLQIYVPTEYLISHFHWHTITHRVLGNSRLLIEYVNMNFLFSHFHRYRITHIVLEDPRLLIEYVNMELFDQSFSLPQNFSQNQIELHSLKHSLHILLISAFIYVYQCGCPYIQIIINYPYLIKHVRIGCCRCINIASWVFLSPK